MKIPSITLALVFSFLDIDECLIVSQVSKQLNQIFKEPWFQSFCLHQNMGSFSEGKILSKTSLKKRKRPRSGDDDNDEKECGGYGLDLFKYQKCETQVEMIKRRFQFERLKKHPNYLRSRKFIQMIQVNDCSTSSPLIKQKLKRQYVEKEELFIRNVVNIIPDDLQISEGAIELLNEARELYATQMFRQAQDYARYDRYFSYTLQPKHMIFAVNDQFLALQPNVQLSDLT
jgi:histone H3/H4